MELTETTEADVNVMAVTVEAMPPPELAMALEAMAELVVRQEADFINSARLVALLRAAAGFVK